MAADAPAGAGGSRAALAFPGRFLLLRPRTSLGYSDPFKFPSPGPFPALTSAKYAADFNEEKAIGEDVAHSTARTADQTLSRPLLGRDRAIFWNRAAATAALAATPRPFRKTRGSLRY